MEILLHLRSSRSLNQTTTVYFEGPIGHAIQQVGEEYQEDRKNMVRFARKGKADHRTKRPMFKERFHTSWLVQAKQSKNMGHGGHDFTLYGRLRNQHHE